MKNSETILDEIDISSTNENVRFIDELNKAAFELRHLNQKKSLELGKKALDLAIKIP